MIDEVLAVGDAEFQKKCMGKMDEVSHKQGRTIMFVSHNMGAVSQLCNRVVCLERGRVALDTPDVSAGVREYLNVSRDTSATAEWRNPGSLFENPWFKPLRFGLYGEDGKAISGPVERKDKVWVEIEGIVEVPDPALEVGYHLCDERNGVLICYGYQTDQMGGEKELPTLEGYFILRTPLSCSLLNVGGYQMKMEVNLFNRERIVNPHSTSPEFSFEISGRIYPSPYRLGETPGILALDQPWVLQPVNSMQIEK